MKHLLVFAGNFIEYQRWVRDNKKELKAKGFEARYIDPRGTQHLGFKDCFYTEVGTFYRTSKHNEIHSYFNNHNIIKI